MSGHVIFVLTSAFVLAIVLALHWFGQLLPFCRGVRNLFQIIANFVITKKLWQSLGVGIFAIIFPLLPFLWGLLSSWISSTSGYFWTMTLGASYLDEWLVGALSVGVIAVANWVESWLDFKMNFWSGFFTFLAGFGGFIFLAAYGVVHSNSSVILQDPSAHTGFIATVYLIGGGIILSSFLSIGETRRAKDLWGVV